MPDLPMELKKLEVVRGAYDILTYLYQRDNHAADTDDIMDDLDISQRRFDKAKRRLVTRNYIQMRSDYVYELTPKGMESAKALAATQGEKQTATLSDRLQRQLVMILPRNFVYGKTSPLHIGIEPHADYQGRNNIIVRVSPTHAELGEFNEMAQLDTDALLMTTTITPAAYDHARIKVEVYQLSQDGTDFAEIGGMYVDVVVLNEGSTGDHIAYSTDLTFANGA